jgi:hypothetical protein
VDKPSIVNKIDKMNRICFVLLVLISLADGGSRKLLCSADYDPVYCTLQGFSYPNRCFAREAGYSDADCTIPKSFGATCPTTVSTRVVCGGIVYSNICLASQAGWVPSTQCTAAPPTAAPTPSPPACIEPSLSCSLTNGSTPCCSGLLCRLSSTGTSPACLKCLAVKSSCRENRDCCTKNCRGGRCSSK